MVIFLPVTPFTHKILITHYGAEPLSIRATDAVASQLCCVKPGSRQRLNKAYASLTEKVALDVTPALAAAIRRQIWRVGLHINDYYREKLNEYVHTCEMHKVQGIQSALQTWCAQNGIEIDIDISHDSLYKDYQRFRKAKREKKHDFFARKNVRFVPKNGQAEKLITDAELDATINAYVMKYPKLFIGARGGILAKRQLQLSCYVYRVLGKRPPQYIAQKFAIPRTPIKNANTPAIVYDDFRIRRAVRSFRDFLRTAPAVDMCSQH